MKHEFKTKRYDDNSVLLTLKITLSEKDQKLILKNSNEYYCKTVKDLKFMVFLDIFEKY